MHVRGGGVRYRTIVADPPWDVKGGPLRGGHAEGFIGTEESHSLPYGSMTVGEIAALPIGGLAEPDAHLYLWTINRYVEEAFEIARAWGFDYSTLLTWAKAPMGGGLGGAYGISSEYILFCRRGSLAAHGRITGTWFNWRRPYNDEGKPKHSAKPEAFFDMVEAVSPGPYVELFSRRTESRMFGWDYWGDESLGTAEMPTASSA